MAERRVRNSRLYTRGGDKGTTGLVGGRRTAKDSLRVETYGTVDELNAALGMVRVELGRGRKDAVARRLLPILTALQEALFDLGGELATAPGEAREMPRVGEAEAAALEALIDEFDSKVPPLRSFVLPGGGAVSGWLHMARTICRRAERRVVSLARRSRQVGTGPQVYLNRLSDLLFALSRWVAHERGEAEVLRKGAKRRG